MESGRRRKIHGTVSFSILEVRPVGRCRSRRFVAHRRRQISLYSFHLSQRILGISRRKGLRQVSTNLFFYCLHLFQIIIFLKKK